MGANTLISLFGIKQNKQKATLPVLLQGGQEKAGTARIIFSRLFGKLLGFSVANEVVSFKAAHLKSALPVRHLAFGNVPTQDSAIAQKEFLLKLAMGSLHSASSFNRRKAQPEVFNALPQKANGKGESASIRLPGGIKILPEALLKHLSKNPKGIQKILVTKSPKGSDKKGAKESEGVFIAIPVLISGKQATVPGKKLPVSGNEDVRAKGSMQKKEKASTELLIALETEGGREGKSSETVEGGAAQESVLQKQTSVLGGKAAIFEESAVRAEGRPVTKGTSPQKAPVLLDTKGTEEKESGKTTKNSQMQKIVLLLPPTNEKTLIWEDKTTGAGADKLAVQSRGETPQKEVFSWMLLPVSEEAESQHALLNEKGATAKVAEMIKKPSGETKGSAKMRAVHSEKEAAVGTLKNEPLAEIPEWKSKRNGEAASPRALRIFKKGGSVKSILISVEGTVKISEKEPIEFVPARDSQKNISIKVQEVDIRDEKAQKRLAQKLPQLMEKARVVKLAAKVFPLNETSNLQFVQEKNASQKVESTEKNPHSTRERANRKQAGFPAEKTSLSGGGKVPASDPSPVGKKNRVTAPGKNLESSALPKSKPAQAQGLHFQQVAPEKLAIEEIISVPKGISKSAGETISQKQIRQSEAKNSHPIFAKKSDSISHPAVQSTLTKGSQTPLKFRQGRDSLIEKGGAAPSGSLPAENDRAAEPQPKFLESAFSREYSTNRSKVAGEQAIQLVGYRKSQKKPAKNAAIPATKSAEKKAFSGLRNQMTHPANHSNQDARPAPLSSNPGLKSEKIPFAFDEKGFAADKKSMHTEKTSSHGKEVLQKTPQTTKSRISQVIPESNFSRTETVSQNGKLTPLLESAAGSPIPKQILNKLVQSTRLLIQQGGAQMQIQLKPDSLGTIRLLVETVQNQINVKILVNKPKTQHLLKQHIQSLQHFLVQQGFKIEHVQVNLNLQSEPFQQGQSFQNQPQQGGDFGQKQGKNQFTNSGNFLNQHNETEQQTRSRRFGYNSVEYVA